MRSILLTLIAAIVAVLLYLFLWPTPIDPLAWEPPEAPAMSGSWEPNTHLRKADYLGAGAFDGPEDIAVDSEGRVYGGTAEGMIRRTTPDGTVETFAVTGGRPLGMGFDADGNLIVADARKGLLSIDPQGEITVLATRADGVPFGFTNDLDIASDGTIYFTDASHRWGQDKYLYDLLEARAHGRLLAHDRNTGETRVLLDGLYFANGVALSEDEDFVLVNETYRYRIRRYWLDGEQAGSADIFIDNLPGFPDNISATGDGRFWLALLTVRNADMDTMHPHPGLKQMVSRLPQALWPAPEPWGFVVALDEQGEVLRSLQDPGGERLFSVTSVKEIDDTLYMGSLYNDRIGVLPLDRVDSLQ